MTIDSMSFDSMSFDYWLAGLTVIGLIAYLAYALLKPERF